MKSRDISRSREEESLGELWDRDSLRSPNKSRWGKANPAGNSTTKKVDKTGWDRDMDIEEMPKKSCVKDIDRFPEMCRHSKHPSNSDRRGEINTAIEPA